MRSQEPVESIEVLQEPFSSDKEGKAIPDKVAEDPQPMPVDSIIRRLNEIKIGDLENLPKEKIDSDRAIQLLIFELSQRHGESVTTHWQLPSRGWQPSKHKWSLNEHRDVTAKELLNIITAKEGWSYFIHKGFLLVKQFHT